MFDKERFVEDCKRAVAGGQAAIRELVERAVSDPAALRKAFGDPQHAGITTLHKAADLTVLHFVWAPCMSLMPHNHQMYSVVGVYCGREDNVFWRRNGSSIEAASAKSLGAGDVSALGKDTIHSVLNPVGRMTCALHVYGGDFFEPPQPRSAWDHETLAEGPYEVERVRAIFRDAEARFRAVDPHG